MTRFPRYFALLAAFVSILLGFSRAARADAAAQALFTDGKKLMQEGKYADACPKLEESQRLAPGIGTQYNLAACYEALGRTATAWSLYLDVAGAAKAASQVDREKAARQSAAGLEPKLSRLTIAVSKSAPADIEVKRDGAAVGRAQWGTAIPVDPGDHQITATAPGKKPWETKFTLGKNGAQETIEVPELEAGVPGQDAPPGPRVQPKATPEGPPKPKTRRRSGGMMAGGIVALSIGTVVSLGGLVGTGLCKGAGEIKKVEDLKDVEDCKKASAVVLISGLVLVGGGVTLTIIGAQKVPVDNKAAKASPIPEISVGPRSAALRWAF